MPRYFLPALLALALPAQAAQIAISHRGASAYAPEHTFNAYDLAIEQDTDMLECDLFLTKDEVPVCIHDQTIDRTSDGSGEVSSFTLAELRQFDFGTWFNEANPTLAKPEYAGAHIVPFEEQLDCYLRVNPRMRFHVETKDSAGGRAEQVMVDLLTRKGLIATGDLANGNVQSSTIVLQSFDAGSLERMRALAPSIPTGFLFSVPDQTTLPWLLSGSGPDYIDFYIPNSALLLLYPLAVTAFHANGHDVQTWTVNDSAQMNLMLALGVDGIFTNNTDLLRAAIDARGSGTTPEERGNPASFEHGCPGIAGRVTSNLGPGDVWEPTGARGVQLKPVSGSSSGGGSGSSGGSSGGGSGGDTPDSEGRFGGGLPPLLLAGLALAALWRRQGRRY